MRVPPLSLLTAALLGASASAYAPSSTHLPGRVGSSPLSRSALQATPKDSTPGPSMTPEQELLRDYLIQAHEEKLRVLRLQESQAEAERASLRARVAALEHELQVRDRASQAAATADLSSLRREELEDLIVQYRTFLADYLVQAADAKHRAVEEAKRQVRAQYEARVKTSEKPTNAVVQDSSSKGSSTNLYDRRNQILQAAQRQSRWGDAELLRVTPATASTTRTSTPTSSSTTPSILPEYQSRNQNVLASWLQGKSRWMEQEIHRLQGRATVPESLTTAVIVQDTNPIISMTPSNAEERVQAADHGLHRDGTPSLGERIAQGVRAMASDLLASGYYQARNQRLLATGTEHSRWAKEEFDRIQNKATMPVYRAVVAQNMDSSPATPTMSLEATRQAIAAADHGIVADGGVRGRTLAERVQRGAATTVDTPQPPAQGNMFLAALEGLTRWGAGGMARLQQPTGLTDEDVVKVQAADHGMAGTQGGASLLERVAQGVNMGQAAVARAQETQAEASPITDVRILYDERNRNVLQQGANSRWGGQELQRIQLRNSTGTAYVVS